MFCASRGLSLLLRDMRFHVPWYFVTPSLRRARDVANVHGRSRRPCDARRVRITNGRPRVFTFLKQLQNECCDLFIVALTSCKRGRIKLTLSQSIFFFKKKNELLKNEPHVQLQTVCVMHTALNIFEKTAGPCPKHWRSTLTHKPLHGKLDTRWQTLLAGRKLRQKTEPRHQERENGPTQRAKKQGGSVEIFFFLIAKVHN